MKRVFVSYSRINLEPVSQLIDDLQSMGIDTWHDQTLTGGQRWWENILANIRECDIFIFALSPESWDSEACRSELSYVVQLGKTILPVLVADGINLNLLPAPLGEVQVIDYRQRDKEAAFAVVKAINIAPLAAPLPEPLPPTPAVPISYLAPIKERIDSSEPLSAQEQITLVFELEERIQEGRSCTEIHDLLLRMKRRDDLLAKVAIKVDAALQAIEDRPATEVHQYKSPGEPVAKPHPSPHGEKMETASGTRPCPRCSTPTEASMRFCGNCGSAISTHDGVPPVMGTATPPVNDIHMQGNRKIQQYRCAPEAVSQLIADVKGWLNAQGFDTQQLSTDGRDLLLQIKKRGQWRELVGMSTSLNILFGHNGDTLTVEIGAGKWIDKAAAGAVSMFLLWPLAITAGIGAWDQAKMPEKIFNYISYHLPSK